MTIVLDLDRHEQSVRLRADGFESCVVSAPGFPSELRLARHYRRPWRTRAGGFVDELLAASLEPARSPAEVRALPETDRASLRRALVASAGCEREWRSLYGCHLTADERLFAVMYWCWRRRLRNREQMQTEHEAYLATMRESVADGIYAKLGLADIVRSSSAVEAALCGAAAKVSVAELVSPKAFGAMKALETHAAASRNIAKLFENPLTSLSADINRITSMASTFENMRALTESVAFRAPRAPPRSASPAPARGSQSRPCSAAGASSGASQPLIGPQTTAHAPLTRVKNGAGRVTRLRSSADRRLAPAASLVCSPSRSAVADRPDARKQDPGRR